ncbi:hypothetical protein CDIK_3620 [Cucumispora dikerogammari]|nr:hypothetical protein CDIK_3620 [Cucumispora dikerogammari]
MHNKGKSLLNEINTTINTPEPTFYKLPKPNTKERKNNYPLLNTYTETTNPPPNSTNKNKKYKKNKKLQKLLIKLKLLSTKTHYYSLNIKELINSYKTHLSIQGISMYLINKNICYCVCLTDINNISDSDNIFVCDNDSCKIKWYHKMCMESVVCNNNNNNNDVGVKKERVICLNCFNENKCVS